MTAPPLRRYIFEAAFGQLHRAVCAYKTELDVPAVGFVHNPAGGKVQEILWIW